MHKEDHPGSNQDN